MSQPSELVLQVSEQIKPILAPWPVETRLAVLANLTSLIIAGHIHPHNKELEREFRDGMLTGYMDLIRDLVPASEQELLDKIVDRSEPQ